MIEIHTKLISGKYTEVYLEDDRIKIESGLMCDSEALEYANVLVNAANEILDCIEYVSGDDYNRCEIKKEGGE